MWRDGRRPGSSCLLSSMADFSNRSNWDHPTPSPSGECVSSSFGSEGGAQFLTTTREGVGGGSNSDEGTDTVAF